MLKKYIVLIFKFRFIFHEDRQEFLKFLGVFDFHINFI